MEKIEGAFDETQKRFFNAKAGAYSRVTEREGKIGGDRSVTIDKREKKIVFQSFTEADIPRQSKEASGHDGFLFRVFRVGTLGKPGKLKLVFPKREGRELRLYFSQKMGFVPEPGDIWFVFQDAVEPTSLVVGHCTHQQWLDWEAIWSMKLT